MLILLAGRLAAPWERASRAGRYPLRAPVGGGSR
jgi:hypothetical protein